MSNRWTGAGIGSLIGGPGGAALGYYAGSRFGGGGDNGQEGVGFGSYKQRKNASNQYWYNMGGAPPPQWASGSDFMSQLRSDPGNFGVAGYPHWLQFMGAAQNAALNNPVLSGVRGEYQGNNIENKMSSIARNNFAQGMRDVAETASGGYAAGRRALADASNRSGGGGFGATADLINRSTNRQAAAGAQADLRKALSDALSQSYLSALGAKSSFGFQDAGLQSGMWSKMADMMMNEVLQRYAISKNKNPSGWSQFAGGLGQGLGGAAGALIAAA